MMATLFDFDQMEIGVDLLYYAVLVWFAVSLSLMPASHCRLPSFLDFSYPCPLTGSVVRPARD